MDIQSEALHQSVRALFEVSVFRVLQILNSALTFHFVNIYIFTVL